MAAVRKDKNEATYTVQNGIAWLKLDFQGVFSDAGPAFNRKAIRILDEIEFNKSVGVVVLIIEEDTFPDNAKPMEHFGIMGVTGMNAGRRTPREVQSWWNRFYAHQKPTIAMIRGGRVGGAHDPVSACDLAFADIDTLFIPSDGNFETISGPRSFMETNGIFPGRKLMYHALTGEGISASIAAEWGLINEALPNDLLQQRVTQVANMLLEHDAAALRRVKNAFNQARRITGDTRSPRDLHAHNTLSFEVNDSATEKARQLTQHP